MSGATASRREQRRQQHHELSRNQLLDAAEVVFGAKGYHDSTLKEVVELAEFSVGSVYSFFESKDDLFSQIFRRRGDEFLPAMTAVLAGRGTALELLHDLVDFEIRFFRAHKHFGRLWLRHASATLQAVERLADEGILHNYQSSMQLQTELFRRGQDEGRFIDGDPEALARLLAGIMSSFQSLDPLVMSDDVDVEPPLSVEGLHSLVERAFCR